MDGPKIVALLVCAWGLCGCGSDETDVVEAIVTNPSATLEDISTTEKGLAGTFTIELQLGPNAENATQTLIEGVQVRDPDQQTLQRPLTITSDPEEPWNLDVDTELVIQAFFATAENPQSDARVAELCQAVDGVVVSLRIADGLDSAYREVSSERFFVTDACGAPP